MEGSPVIIFIFKYILGFRFSTLFTMLGCMSNWYETGAYYTLFTMPLVHQFLPHFLVNLFGLLYSGKLVEKRFGIKSFVITFIISTPLVLIISNFIQNILFPIEGVSMAVGASGFIFALIGFSTIIYFKEKEYAKKIIKKSQRIYLIIYGILFTWIVPVLTNGMWSTIAHNIGLLIGIIIGLVFYKINAKTKLNQQFLF